MPHFARLKSLFLALCVIALFASSYAQTQPGLCGSQPYCVETNDFVASITNFRTSMTTSNVKVIDTTIRFQNKTNHPLVLAYLQSSGVAMDDRGNRLIVGGPNGFHGIGLVVGSNFEPKFVVRPGGYGDAQFELVAQGWPKLVGFSHSMDLTIDEINSFEGNQHTLGGEFPLHFEGLRNGSAGSSPAIGSLLQSGAANPCGTTAQGAASKAGSAVSSAANTLSNLGSLFGKKKAAANAGQVANAAGGCDPRINDMASKAGMVAGATAAANQNTSQLNTAVAQAPAQQNLQAYDPQPAVSPTADQSAPVGQTAANPGDLAVGSYSKTKQAQLKRDQQKLQRQAGKPGGDPTKSATQQVASVGAASAVSASTQGQSSEPWTPPTESGTPATRVAPTHLDSTKMPDIIGVHLGMDPKEAVSIVRGHYPKNLLTPYDNNMSTFPSPVFQGAYINPATNFQDEFNFLTTLPPDKQVVWKVRRITKGMHINRETLLAALRTKYGKESVATGNDPRAPINGDAQVTQMLWLFDEAGRHIPVPYSNAFIAMDCGADTPAGPGGGYLLNEAHGEQSRVNGWCASSYVGVKVYIGHTEPIVETVMTEMIDLPLALRTSHSTAAWYRAESERARKADLERSKQAKPVF
jgi:hypothetical protein